MLWRSVRGMPILRRRLHHFVLLLLGLILLAAEPVAAAWAQDQKVASESAAVVELIASKGERLSTDRTGAKFDLNYEIASGSPVAARTTAQLTGQMHHGISRTVYKALEQHPNLKGLYTARDPRFLTQAKDLAAHRSYDTFHRNLDAEIAGWVRSNPNATQAQFESYLRGVYQRPDVLAHFPNGL